MREITFRAYDKVLGMCDVLNVDFFYSTVLVVQQNNDTPEMDSQYYTLSIENANLQQFTGLKDKNGKEIYEGDIMDARPECGGIHDVKFLYEYHVAGLGIDCSGNMGMEHMEIIGNIYENPELLSAQEK